MTIRDIHLAAFPGPEEANLVEALAAEGAVLLSLDQNEGHVLFSRMWIGETPAVALAPLAVHPQRHRQGVGSALVRAGLQTLAERGERIVVVVGDPAYYGRFGFSKELASGFTHPFPPDYCMALELVPGALTDINGRARYAKAFGLGEESG